MTSPKLTREQIERWRRHVLVETEPAMRPAFQEWTNILCDMALAHLASAEPVAWRFKQHPGHSQWSYYEYPPVAFSRTAIVEPLYPAPATVTQKDSEE